MSKKNRVKKKEVLFSIDNYDGSLSINAHKHLRRTVRGYLQKLDIDFHTGKVDVKQDGTYDIFYVDAKHEDAVKQLLKTYGQELYVVMEDTDNPDVKEMSRMRISGNTTTLKDFLNTQRIKAEDKEDYKTVFFDGKSKSYWAVIASIETAAA